MSLVCPEGSLFKELPFEETPHPNSEEDRPPKRGNFKRVRTRMRNSFEHGLAWSYISNALRDMVDSMKQAPHVVQPDFQFPPAADYKRYELWLRDTLQAMQKALKPSK